MTPTPKKIEPKGSPLPKREQNTRPLRKYFIIVCEGKETEPNYFEQFRGPKEVKVEVIGEGANTVVVVQRAIKEKQKNHGLRYGAFLIEIHFRHKILTML